MPNFPQSRTRRRLLAILAGLSPQVVTETTYGLAVASTPAWIPDEVHLITTREGAERARLTLFGSENWFGRLCLEYNLNGVDFSEEHIHIVGESGRDLDDIRTTHDNRVAADFIADRVRDLTSDPDTEVALSIAGGRKTMGVVGGAASSLFGRPQDRLLHVLIWPAAFEAHPGFFYPTKNAQIIYSLGSDSRPMDCSTAGVMLAEIPFVRLREWLPQRELLRPSSWSDIVAAAQDRLEPPRLELVAQDCRILAAGQDFTMPLALFAFYLWLARRAARGRAWLSAPDEHSALEYTAEYRRAYFDSGGSPISRTIDALNKEQMTAEFFVERRSRINSILRSTLGWRVAPYLIRSRGKRPNTEYGMELQADSMRIR
jgi:CRISPR-associated protein (TIGR02584 family)